MSRSVWKGPFVDLYQDLVASLDNPASVRWPDVQRL